MKKLLVSILTVGVVGAAAIAGANAFFSDTETSTGNTFTAGAIDLKIDNESYGLDYNVFGPTGASGATGALVASPNTSWTLNDLTVEKFFNFVDLKPGDYGEDTISIHVNDNDAWLCAAAQITQDTDETCVDPEVIDDPTCTAAANQGELDSQVNFSFWKDDGDNVLESDETSFLSGPISSLNGTGQIALADNSAAVFGTNTPIPGNTDVYIGKAWCFGNLVAVPVAQDGVNTSGPLVRTTGFTCDGSAVNNAAQTDKVVGDMQFYAVQARNNATFTCAGNYVPTWPI